MSDIVALYKEDILYLQILQLPTLKFKKLIISDMHHRITYMYFNS